MDRIDLINILYNRSLSGVIYWEFGTYRRLRLPIRKVLRAVL